eukprot:53696-Eustigmatos_ZCMA.PRE.1
MPVYACSCVCKRGWVGRGGGKGGKGGRRGGGRAKRDRQECRDTCSNEHADESDHCVMVWTWPHSLKWKHTRLGGTGQTPTDTTLMSPPPPS